MIIRVNFKTNIGRNKLKYLNKGVKLAKFGISFSGLHGFSRRHPQNWG